MYEILSDIPPPLKPKSWRRPCIQNILYNYQLLLVPPPPHTHNFYTWRTPCYTTTHYDTTNRDNSLLNTLHVGLRSQGTLQN